MSQQPNPGQEAPAVTQNRPQTIDQALEQQEATPEEAKALEAGQAPTEGKANPGGNPPWCPLPTGLKIPIGKSVTFMRFRATWTDRPDLGDRSVVLWPLSDTEILLANDLARGNDNRTVEEMAKMTIRAIDGMLPDRTGNPPVGTIAVSTFWTQISEKCRRQLKVNYMKTHTLSQEEQIDFFTNCFAVRTAAG